MNPILILSSTVLGIALVSCASQEADTYDTSNPYGAPDASTAYTPGGEINPVYDTPAAYEESGAAPTPAPAFAESAATPAASAPSGNGPAIIHTVVRGDTLSGLSSKYRVPIASIKQANRMTNDTVVLGRKMVIPPR
ncbi:MAG: LysM peptidoglycan-binding domain-containing protein [Akkermansiaceae bacterium]|jgi:LysM repeat protein|nr:LysM peptidoglycan-binding domain-containing protein [Akkermansiaceae bacterium]